MTTCLTCGRTIPRGPRCPPCQRAHKAKYSRAAGHPQLREAWAPFVAEGIVTCARADTDPQCTGLIDPTDAWDLDHIDGRSHPSHSLCNRRAGGAGIA